MKARHVLSQERVLQHTLPRVVLQLQLTCQHRTKITLETSHTCTHTLTQTHTHTQTFIHTHMNTDSHTKHARTNTLAHKHKLTHKHSHNNCCGGSLSVCAFVCVCLWGDPQSSWSRLACESLSICQEGQGLWWGAGEGRVREGERGEG